MKRFFVIICSLLICGANSAAVKLLPEDRDLLIKYVQQYCELLKDFSCNMENVTLMDSIVAKCENNKVQMFNDLTTEHSKSNIEYNSVPLFQYLQNITTKYDNELEMSFSDFKCEKTVSEPPMGNAMGNASLQNSYALIHVLKKIKGKNINVTVPLKITINTSNLKIGGTVSEEYEVPHSIYLRGLELYQDGKMGRAREYFEKCTTYRTYSGRYRAMTMIGMSFFLEEQWEKAIDILTKASEHDPVGGIYLAELYMDKKLQLELRNPQKALLLLEKYANVRDKDFPITRPWAKLILGSIYAEGKKLPADKEKAKKYIDEAKDLATKENELALSTICGIYDFASLIDETRSTESQIKQLNIIIEKLIPLLPTIELQHVFYPIIYGLKVSLYCGLKQYDEALKTAMKLTEYDPAKGNYKIAEIYKNTQRYELALMHYQIAADMGEPESCYIVSCYYLPFENLNEAGLDDFDKFIHLSHTNKNKEKAAHYLKKAAEKGKLDAMFNLAIMYSDPKYCMVDYNEMVKWALLRDENGYSYNDLQANQALTMIAIYTINKKHYEIVDILKQYATNKANANLILSEIYRADEFPQKDSLISFEYVKKGAELGSPACMAQMAYFLLNNKDTLACERICSKLIEKRYPWGLTIMGGIEKDRKHYKKAYDYYRQAHEMKLYAGSMELAEMYLEGLGMQKDIDKAIEYADSAMVYAKFEDCEWAVDELWQKCHAARTNGDVVQQAPSSPDTPDISGLLQIANTNLSADNRIALSEEMQEKLFASSKAIVKTIGSNGNTVVSTETAEDFMLRLSTSIHINKITMINCITDEHGKIKEMTIKEE